MRQWLPLWDDVPHLGDPLRRKPEPYIYVGSMPASTLKQLSGVFERLTTERQAGGSDLGIQRRHEKSRSAEIRRFVKYGFPLSTLNAGDSGTDLFGELQMPGWLPTSIIANIKTAEDLQVLRVVDPQDQCTISQVAEGSWQLELPMSFTGSDWQPKASRPIEIIDGQHRLFAFEDVTESEDYELPIVLFHGLDLAWQAYLFYVINIKPKKINPSLAFDLYPMLRQADWLEQVEGPKVYRETRAQELTEALWSYPESPWHQRINMLGTTGSHYPTQATWVRALVNTFIKRGNRHTAKNRGGLFGCLDNENAGWSRIQQAAFIIKAWSLLFETILSARPEWLIELERPHSSITDVEDLFDKRVFATSDQGIRSYMLSVNALIIEAWDDVQPDEWIVDDSSEDMSVDTLDDVTLELTEYSQLIGILEEIASCAASFDWRSAEAPKLTEVQRRSKQAYRGSGGYNLARLDLLTHIAGSKSSVSMYASALIGAPEND